MATALVIGNIIGSAIFMLPAAIAPYGWNAVAAWGITFVGALSLAWVLSALARSLPDVGGSYGFMKRGVGEGAAFVGAWGYIVSVWAANAGITIAGISYLTRLLPWLERTPGAASTAALATIWLFAWVNLRGLRSAGGMQSATTIIKLLPFVAVIGLAFWRIASLGAAALPPISETSFSVSGASGAVGLTLFAMLGLESAAIPADVVEDPERNVPRATMVGTSLSAIVTLVATCSVALMLPLSVVSTSNAPVSDFIATAFGSAAGTLVALCAVISCLGCLNGWLLLSGELPASMARAGALPAWFALPNGHAAPSRGIVLGAIVSSALTLLAYTRVGVAAYNFATLIATATNLVLYLLCVVAVARFMRDGRVPRSRSLVAATALAFAFVLWAFYSSGAESLAWGGALTAAGWPIYRLARRAATTAV